MIKDNGPFSFMESPPRSPACAPGQYTGAPPVRRQVSSDDRQLRAPAKRQAIRTGFEQQLSFLNTHNRS